MEPAQEPLLRYMWRNTPRGWRVAGALVVLGLVAWGISGLVEDGRRTRLREEIRAYLAALPPVPPEPAVAAEDNAAPALLEAMAAVKVDPMRPELYSATLESGGALDAGMSALLEKNAEALRLLEVALRKPGFAPGPPRPPGARPYSRDSWDLRTLVMFRSMVAFRAGRVGEAVDAALLAPRMDRRIGPGRAPPWDESSTHDSRGTLEVLEAAVADERLDEAAAEAILRDLPSGEEERVASVADFEANGIRDLGARLVKFLEDDAEEKARASGWRPPTLHERMLVAIGKRKYPHGVEPFPSAGQFREIWEASTVHRPLVGLRGQAAVSKFGPVPLEVIDDIYIREGASAIASAVRRQMETEARLEVVRAAAALRLFEMRNGRPPASLAELSPDLLPAGTKDPFTERPLVFWSDAERWVVSSAGPGGGWAGASGNPPAIRWKHAAPVPGGGKK